jgi:hypothetical protein
MKLFMPMTPGGGAFLACVGAALMTSPLLPSTMSGTALLAGFALGIAALIAASVAGRLRGLPKPATHQMMLVWIPVVAEMAIFFLVFPQLTLDERTRVIAVIAVVGAHFLPMIWSFGPLIAWLGLACISIAAAGLLAPQLPIGVVIAIDGLLKLSVGLVMLGALFRVPARLPSQTV